ncbi:hypothetical protein EOD08_25320 [Mesorhizobium sp. M6A.T.Ca.TU.002.02.2.1]|uniref:hypothetical protein n=1 Tax=Mesorhizobium sp. M6A.T.Ce.TU.016.01.1.1 TaxID=2496783 RepID=UPI000FC9F926|nr:hypothetical protein [Mesorhizobium sp. M6A.T.Ce.TU.016.01.1.1]RUU24080.1 hypothetical protein EOD08_25320 [Mesorhizobium sp. M6A.T.Ca.TU.002.02.2.1]RUU26016.1 hypothetical protein EOC94_28915 [Mesorhizobium sp. M6A.T.Ce.TU.016.01.1.1]
MKVRSREGARHIKPCVGSHEGNASREAVLDCFELLQDAIAKLFGQQRSKLASMKQRLINAKGRL